MAGTSCQGTIPGAIESVRSHRLGLSHGELGWMFGVPGETVCRWASRRVRIPERRPAEAFGGRCALDLVIEGRTRGLAEIHGALLEHRR